MAGVMLAGGLAMSVAAFGLVRAFENERTAQEFQWRAEMRRGSLDSILRGAEETAFAMRDLLETATPLTGAEFGRAAKAQIARHPGLDSIEWLPLVRQEERAQFEARARAEGLEMWVIRDQPDDPEPAGSRAEYLPLLYKEPGTARERVLGVDQFIGNYQRAIQQARETGRPIATRRLALDPARKSGPFGVAIVLPVYESSGASPVPGAEPGPLRGFIRCMLRMQDLAMASMVSIEPPAVDVLLMDRTPAGTEPHLFSVIGGRFSTKGMPVEVFQRGMYSELPLMCAGRKWVLVARPEADWLAARRTLYPVAFFFIGTCLTFMLVAWKRQRDRRAQEVERLVLIRTEELRETQEQLRDDITRRRAAEARYRGFVEQSSEAIWQCELDEPMPLSLSEDAQVAFLFAKGYVADCNDICARMYGCSCAEEMQGVRLSELLPKDDGENVDHLRHYIRNQFRLIDVESEKIDREGVRHVFLNNMVGIVEKGCLVRAWGTQREVTELRRYEAARVENERRLRLAMEAAGVGTWQWDSTTRKVTWTEEVSEIFGFTADKFGHTFESYMELVHPEDRERVEDALRLAVVSGGEFEYDYRVVQPGGSIRWVITRGDVQRDAKGNLIGMLGASLDVTARKQAEAERVDIEKKLQETQKLESLGILAGGIAHDFNNLLTGILGNASLARMDLAATSPVQQSLAQIEQAAQRAAELCKQMLAYSGKGRFVVQPLDLSHLIEDAASLLQVSVSKSAMLKYRLAKDLPAVQADATQLRQILMNLVINASDAMGERLGSIEISTGVIFADRAYLSATHLAPTIPEGDYVFLEVSDNGCGMDAETQARIFDPFFTTKFTGRGLGLAAVLGIVRGHRGALKVYSEPGVGTTFKLLLPVAKEAAQKVPRELQVPSTWRGRGVLLIVDDEETVRTVASRMVTAIGFTPIATSSGQEAIGFVRARGREVAAVMLDLTMPEMDGAEVFTELRRIQPEIRVLLMSGFNEQEAVNRFAGKGLSGFLQKPFRPDVLREKLRAICEPVKTGQPS